MLFLRPILKYWKDSGPYQEINLTPILDVSLAMKYHDRGNLIQDLISKDIEVPFILRVMRISDELQEWDRESNSFIDDVKLNLDPNAILSLDFKMKDKSEKERCDPEKFIPDKIKGILPALKGGELIKLNFTFPEKFNLNTITKHFEIDSSNDVLEEISELRMHCYENKAKLLLDDGELTLKLKEYGK